MRRDSSVPHLTPTLSTPKGRRGRYWLGAATVGLLVAALFLTLGTAIAAPKPKPAPDAPAPPPPPPAVVNGAELQALDKISARTTKFAVPFGQSVRFGTLVVSVTDCRKNPPEEQTESAAFLDIQEIEPGSTATKPLFHGWMFASSPALNPLEHPVYDVWVLDCSTASGSSAKPG
jgi:hypothetical protein